MNSMQLSRAWKINKKMTQINLTIVTSLSTLDKLPSSAQTGYPNRAELVLFPISPATHPQYKLFMMTI